MKKILVADDSPVAAAMLSRLLRGAGCEVVSAIDGIEAVQRAYSEAPDLVILDIFMPRMNGYQVCRLLKTDPAVADLPVIILTGSESQSAEFWSLHTGADAFMTKGFDPPDLLATVERLLGADTVAGARAPATPPGARPSRPPAFTPGAETSRVSRATTTTASISSPTATPMPPATSPTSWSRARSRTRPRS
jgi:twitching motility two-component system response regulator PilH